MASRAMMRPEMSSRAMVAGASSPVMRIGEQAQAGELGRTFGAGKGKTGGLQAAVGLRQVEIANPNPTLNHRAHRDN
jgi:hypothetical protein